MDIEPRLLVWRTDLLLRRAARQRRRRLVREIAEYRTQAERDDLLAAIERCPSAGREEIRALLDRAVAGVESERTPFHLRT
jgi:hypothetical protein